MIQIMKPTTNAPLKVNKTVLAVELMMADGPPPPPETNALVSVVSKSDRKLIKRLYGETVNYREAFCAS